MNTRQPPAITMTRSAGGDTQPIQLLTVEEVADILRTTPGAIYNQRHRGDVPGSLGIRVGRRILFHVRNLEAFLAEEGAAQGAARGD